MTITIIDAGSGNLRSAQKAFEKAAGAEVRVTSRAEDLKTASRIVLPGQGAFGDVMQGLAKLPGMVEALTEEVVKKGKPFFGICVGMQLLADKGLEHGTHKGLGWLGGEVRKLELKDPALKIPHMGWNNLRFEGSRVRGFEEKNNSTNPRTREPTHPLLKDLGLSPYVYFVHSYAFYPAKSKDTLATCDYGGAFTAMVVRGNIAGTQFHPEKSQKIGLQLIRNFLEWKP